MVCTRPIRAWYSKGRTANGKRYLVFKESQSDGSPPFDLSCGRCDACLLERSRQWAVRCEHEASMHVNNCYLTLTYDGKTVPKDGNVAVRELQLFFKKLRKKLDVKIRYFACGEYGAKRQRPHYHACVFGWFPPDAYWWETLRGYDYYRSPLLESVWTQGFSTVSCFSFKTAAYVARYVCKKAFGKDAVFTYGEVDRKTGEIVQIRTPEFVVMSRRPGLGADWVSFFHEEIQANDSICVNGARSGVPRYYDKLSALLDPEELEDRKLKRNSKRKVYDLKRLGEKELVLEARAKLLKRGYENGKS